MGKKTKMRECPAAGRQITSTDCAIGRHTTYACPDECGFNLFAARNYQNFRSIEASADTKFLKWMEENAPDRTNFGYKLSDLADEGPTPAYYHFVEWHGVHQVGSDGETLIGKWAKADFPGLNADERIVMKGKMRTRPAMVEVHRILDDHRVEVVDLMDSQRVPLLVVDYGFAAQVLRFGVYFVSLAPLPHYWRLFGSCVMIPNLHPLEPEEVIHGIVTHLGGPADEVGIRRWLAEHALKFGEALMAVALARRQLMFSALDAQMGRALYELLRPSGECGQRLESVPEIADDPLRDEERKEGFQEAMVWFAGPDDPEARSVGKGAVLGRILLGATHARIEAMGAERLARMRERFETLMQDCVKFAGERRDDLGARLRMKEPEYDRTLVPPALLREPPRIVTALSRVQATEGGAEATAIERIKEKQLGILDEPIPALDNKTPREAARNPALRSKLIAWMKFWVFSTDQRNLETGRNDDVNWMISELGLTELLFDPPPRRAPVGPRESLPDDDDVDEIEDEMAPWELLPDPPPLPERPWNAGEAGRLLTAAAAAFPPPSHVADYFADLEYPLFPDLSGALGMSIDDDLVSWIFQASSWLVLCFAPPGTRPPGVLSDDLFRHLEIYMQKVRNWVEVDPGEAMPEWITGNRQPMLLQLALGILLQMIDKTPWSKTPIGEAKKDTLMAVVAAVLDALDEAARAEQELPQD